MSSSNGPFSEGNSLSYGRFGNSRESNAVDGVSEALQGKACQGPSSMKSISCPPKKRAQESINLPYGQSTNSLSLPQDLSVACSTTTQCSPNRNDRTVGFRNENSIVNVVSSIKDAQMYSGSSDLILSGQVLSNFVVDTQNVFDKSSLTKNGMRVAPISFRSNAVLESSNPVQKIQSGSNLTEVTKRQITSSLATGGLTNKTALVNLIQGKDDGRKKFFEENLVTRLLPNSSTGEEKCLNFDSNPNGKSLSDKDSEYQRNSVDSASLQSFTKAGIPIPRLVTTHRDNMASLLKPGKIHSSRMNHGMLALKTSPDSFMSVDTGLIGDPSSKLTQRNAAFLIKQEKGTFWPEKPKIDTGNLKSSIVLTNLQRGNIPTIMQTVVEPVEKDIHQKAGHGELHEGDLLGPNDVNERDQHRKTPLMWASMFGQTPTVGLLLSRKADVNAIDLSQYTALHFAAAGGHHEIVKMLLSSGAIVDARDCHRNTPLMISVMKNHAHVVNELILSGASLVKLNKSHHNALALAVNYKAKDSRLVIENQLRSVMRGMAGKEKVT